MAKIIVGSATLNQRPFDWEHNCTNILTAIAAAKDNGVQILCLPAMCITGPMSFPGTEDPETLSNIERACRIMCEIREQLDGICAPLSVPITGPNENFVREGCILVQDRAFVPFCRMYPEVLFDANSMEDRLQIIRSTSLQMFFGSEEVTVGVTLDPPDGEMRFPFANIILNPCADLARNRWRSTRSFAEENCEKMNMAWVYSGPIGPGGKGAFINCMGETVKEGCTVMLEDAQLITAEIEVPGRTYVNPVLKAHLN